MLTVLKSLSYVCRISSICEIHEKKSCFLFPRVVCVVNAVIQATYGLKIRQGLCHTLVICRISRGEIHACLEGHIH
jgi:hypothetical protein